MSKSPASKVVVGSLVVSLLIGGGVLFYQKYHHDQKEKRDSYSGNVDVRDVTLAFRVAGRVDEVLKTEGDRVQPGDVLARLDAAPLKLALAQAQAALDVATAQVKNVEAGARREDISQARARLTESKAVLARATDTHDRIQRLQASGAATAQALTDAKAALEQAQAGVAAHDANLKKLLNGARAEEILIAHAQAAQAQATIAVAELNVSDSVLRAKTRGVIVTRVIEPGTMVQPGSPALVVALEDPVYVRGFAPQADLARLAPGTQVNVLSDARPHKPYAGQVGYVSPQAEFTPKNVETKELRSSLVYRFRVVVSEHDGGLRQGMPVTIVPQVTGRAP